MMDELREECLRYAEQEHAEALARLEHAISYSRSGLHAALLANGGALIGLFTLIAPHRDLAAKLWCSGLAFSVGMLLTLAAWFFATFAQDKFQISSKMRGWNYIAQAAGRETEFDDESPIRHGNWCVRASYAMAGLAIIAFITGCLLTLKALA